MVIHINKNNFEQEVLKSDMPVLLDFSAAWCGPCKMVGPIVESMAEEYKGKAKIAKLDIDESAELAMRFGVMSVPTLMFFKEGKIVDKVIGAVPKTELSTKMNHLL